jgi:hypothetical protein
VQWLPNRSSAGLRLPTPFGVILTHNSNQNQSPLLRLPAELRNQIFEYVCFRLNHVQHVHSLEWFLERESLTPHWVGLTRTCRQISRESSLLPYTHNSFLIKNGVVFRLLLPRLARLRQPLFTLRLVIGMYVDLEEITGLLAEMLPDVMKVEVEMEFQDWCPIGDRRSEIAAALMAGSRGETEIVFLTPRSLVA